MGLACAKSARRQSVSSLPVIHAARRWREELQEETCDATSPAARSDDGHALAPYRRRRFGVRPATEGPQSQLFLRKCGALFGPVVSRGRHSRGCRNRRVQPPSPSRDAGASANPWVEFTLYSTKAIPLKIVQIHADNGIVTLTGTVSPRAERLLAEKTAKPVEGLRRVVNGLAAPEKL